MYCGSNDGFSSFQIRARLKDVSPPPSVFQENTAAYRKTKKQVLVSVLNQERRH